MKILNREHEYSHTSDWRSQKKIGSYILNTNKVIADAHTLIDTHGLSQYLLEILTFSKGFSGMQLRPQPFFQGAIYGPFLKSCWLLIYFQVMPSDFPQVNFANTIWSLKMVFTNSVLPSLLQWQDLVSCT